MPICSKNANHTSTDSQFCSICGARVIAVKESSDEEPKIRIDGPRTSAVASVENSASVSESCPDCGWHLQDRHQRFCSICRFDFVVRDGSVEHIIETLGSDAPDTVHAASGATTAFVISAGKPSTVSHVAAGPSKNVSASGRWEVHVRVDCSLYVDPDPDCPCPSTEAPLLFHLDLPEQVIGRRSQSKKIFPEIPLLDPGVSHRHGKLLVEVDGSLYFLDVGSANGTKLNGTETAAGAKLKLRVGDELTMGCWTRIKIARH
jgi:hypothetical protein